MSGIFWLASFPKSGNTWTRAFLAELTNEEGEELDINFLATGAIGSSREWVQNALGFEIGELTHEEIDALRPKAYQWIADQDETGYHKIHDAYTYLDSGEPLIPVNATKGALYLVRNPFDVAVSYANHSQIDIAEAVEHICDPELAFCQSKKAQPPQLRQILMSWSDHVQSWLEADIPKLLCRYEDMCLEPKRVFSEVVQFLGIETTGADIDKAIEQTSFERLRQQEAEKGFSERIYPESKFFRKGQVGDWQNVLTDEQVGRIIAVNGSTMRKLGYLDADNNPTALAIGAEDRSP